MLSQNVEVDHDVDPKCCAKNKMLIQVMLIQIRKNSLADQTGFLYRCGIPATLPERVEPAETGSRPGEATCVVRVAPLPAAGTPATPRLQRGDGGFEGA